MSDAEKWLNKIHQGDSLEVLKQMPGNFVDCIVTSPSYYAKRDYEVSGQIGLEKTIDGYLSKILAVMQELKRVLKKEGTFFLNLGDTYSGSHQGFGMKKEVSEKENLVRREIFIEKYKHTIGKPPPNAKSRIPAKSMMGIPWRVAISMIDNGWILRNDCVWHRINALPESVKDRFSIKHEYVFFFVKNRKYYFDLDAVREPLSEETLKRMLRSFGKRTKWKDYSRVSYINQPAEKYNPLIHHQSGKGKTIIGDYYEKISKYVNNFVGLNGQGGQIESGGINSKNSSYKEKLREYAWWYFNVREKHDWTSKKLIEDKTQLRAGMSYKRLTQGMNEALKPENLPHPFGKNPGTIWQIPTAQSKLFHFATFPEKLVEKCVLCGCPEGGIVLDPFMGSGTVGAVAKRLKRNYIGIDLKNEYCEMARKRIAKVPDTLF